MSKLALSLAVVAHHTDCGDGSFSVTFYNSREELRQDLIREESETTLEDIEGGDDPYEHGTLSEETIEVELDEDTQSVRLIKPFSVNSDG